MQRQFTLSILLSLLLCACAPSNLVSEPSAKPSLTPEPTSQVQTTSTGKSREQIEKIDIDNCDGKADITQTAERTQSLDIAVSTEIAAKFGAEAIVKAEIESVIGASVNKGGQTKKSIGLTAPPGTHMLFEIAWSDEEEVGIVVNFKGSGLPVNFRRYAPIGVTIKKQNDLGDCKPPQSGSSETSARPTSTIIPTIIVPAAATDTPILPTATPQQPTATSSPATPTFIAPTVAAPTSTDIPSGKGRPSGRWSVRCYNNDNIGVVLVNGQIVAACWWNTRLDSGWIEIDSYLSDSDPNEIIVASWDDGGLRGWGFGIRRNATVVWGNEKPQEGGAVGMSFVERLKLTPEGRVERVPPDVKASKALADKWFVRVQNVQDIGVVLVNGMPVLLAEAGVNNGWIDITGNLFSSGDSLVTLITWNFDGPFAYDVAIKRNDTIVWGTEKTGGGIIGVVLAQKLTISPSGEIKEQ